MNWYKRAQLNISLDNLDLNDLNRIETDCKNTIIILNNLKEMFPTGKFNSSVRQIDMLIKEGPVIRFFVLYDNIKDKIDKLKIYFREDFIISLGIKIEGFLQSSGFDYFEYGEFKQKVPNLYKIISDKFVPAEKTVDMINLGILAGSPDNLINLIEYNVLSKIDVQKVKIKYEDNPIYREMKEKVLSEKIDIDGAVDLFKNNVDNITIDKKEKELLFSEFKGWFWKNKPDVEFEQNIENALSKFYEEEKDKVEKEIKETGRDPYVFYRDMNPKREGKGKYVINVKDLEPVIMRWGDFSVLVRYQTGRMVYPASKIVEWDESEIDDDQSYNFFNQMDGIRDLSVIG